MDPYEGTRDSAGLRIAEITGTAPVALARGRASLRSEGETTKEHRTVEGVETHVQRLIACAPPLTSEQRVAVSALLSGFATGSDSRSVLRRSA